MNQDLKLLINASYKFIRANDWIIEERTNGYDAYRPPDHDSLRDFFRELEKAKRRANSST